MSASVEDIEEEKLNYAEQKGPSTTRVTDEYDSEAVKIDVHSGLYDGMQRTLEQRHVQMIALAGTLGAGLFIYSGSAISTAGPAGALIAYLLMGSIVWSVMNCLAEMMCFAPIAGSYIQMAQRYIHPSVSFALGYLLWYSAVISLPTEVVSATLVLGYWTEMTTAKLAGTITGFLLFSVAVNFLGTRIYGEVEHAMGWLKVLLVIGLILGGLIIDLGGNPAGDRIGFRYWKEPGAFAAYLVPGNLGRFLAWFQILMSAAYSFSGVEAISFAIAEVVDPRRNMASCYRKIFWRLLCFYILAILIVGMLVPSDDPELLQYTGDAASSPFVIAFHRVGIKVLPSIVNGGILLASLSAATACLYGSSRTLYGLSLRGQAPKIFAKCTKSGMPIVAIFTSAAFSPIAYLTLSNGSSTVLTWFANLTSLAAYLQWGSICVSFIRYKAACEAQGIDRSASKYVYSRWQPLPAYWALFWCITITIFNGYAVFMAGGWNTSDFIVAYITLPIVAILGLGHWLIKGRPQWKSPAEIDLVSNVPGSEIDFDPNPPTTKAGKFMRWLL